MAGRGHIALKGKVWYVVVDGPRDPLNPKKRNQKWIRTEATNRKEAEKARTKVLRGLDTGVPLTPARLTLARYADGWLASRVTLALYTRNTYRRNLDRYILPHLGNLPIGTIAPLHVREWLTRLRTAGNLAESTLTNIFATLSICLESAVRLEVIARNPAKAIERPVPDSEERAIWDGDQARRFVGIIAGNPDEVFYLTAIGTGLRKGELLALRWEDVDLAAGVLHVRRGMIALPGGGVEFTKPKTKHALRRISLSEPLVAMLRDLRDRQALIRAHRAKGWNDADLVFCSRQGTAIPITTATSRWQRLRWQLVAEGLPHIAFHDLRHLHATLAIEQGVDPKTVSLRMGHHSTAFTLDKYGHVTKKMDDGAAEAMQRALWPEEAADAADD